MLRSDQGTCFACGKANPHGLALSFQLDSETCCARADVRLPEHVAGWPGIAHGGIVCTVLDEAAVYAARAAAHNQPAATAALQVRFRKPVPVDTPLTVQAHITRRKRRTLQAHAAIHRDDQLLAEADVTLLLLNPRDPTAPLAFS